jgi:hypothetical protein
VPPGLETETVTLPEDDPNEFEAVRVYVVVEAGVTDTLVPVTAPMPGLMVSVVKSVTFQANTDDPPGPIAAGVAVKEAIVGAEEACPPIPVVAPEPPPHPATTARRATASK